MTPYLGEKWGPGRMTEALVLVIAVCHHGDHNGRNTPQGMEMVHIVRE